MAGNIENEFEGYVVLDIETTGLNPSIDVILEIGIVVIDNSFNELGARSWVYPIQSWLMCDDVVKEMHIKNNLFSEATDAYHKENSPSQESIVKWLRGIVGDTQFPMTGSTISFDRAFLKKQRPYLEQEFHYRNVDISTIRAWLSKLGFVPPKGRDIHRSLPDCRDSINVLKAATEYVKGVSHETTERIEQ